MQSWLHNLCTVGVMAFLVLLVLIAGAFLMSVFGPPVVERL